MWDELRWRWDQLPSIVRDQLLVALIAGAIGLGYTFLELAMRRRAAAAIRELA